MEVKSYAKINWTLRVTGRRADGYHDLETVFQTVSLHDTLTFERAPSLKVTCDDPTIPTDERNLVTRATRLLGVDGVAIHIAKQIPAGGGLGGGSSNAAATLVTLAKMFDVDTDLAAAALQLGSDVPFFLLGGTAYATGRGERLERMPDAEALPLLLVFPPVRVSTAQAYSALRQFSAAVGRETLARALDDIGAHRDTLVNDFEAPVFDRYPQLAAIKSRLLDLGAVWAAMTGSGSTIVGAFADGAARTAAAGEMREFALRTCTAVPASALGGPE